MAGLSDGRSQNTEKSIAMDETAATFCTAVSLGQPGASASQPPADLA
ncbi:hypothetical protein ACFFTN_08695 [Aminobacter aganoensis]|uniref:Uncharacterized protein n=1 Tax=Aminobacter aganoensis TaxID=83264 RepID=A0A7X0KLF2_9HYPH|nr:hypothetical protein [Aminobacter aganoensis]MBB6354944.1 hypothetical protein [Aminobacter aganoensis]